MLTKGIGQKAKKKKKQKESEIVKQTKNNDQEVKKTLKDMTILLRSNGSPQHFLRGAYYTEPLPHPQ